MTEPLTHRIYNGLDVRTGWPVITYVEPKKESPRKKWWRRLLGL